VYETWFQLRSRSFPRPVVVLDVSAAAGPLWPVLQSTVEGLAEELPVADQPDIAFLGGTVRYPLDTFLKQAHELYAVNRGRGRVISPLLESFGAHWPARVVVVCTRPVIDLADWRSYSTATRLAVIRTDPTLPLTNGLYPETELADVRSVAAVVHQPVKQIRLRVEGGLPVAWDNPSYHFEKGNLVADPSTGGWDVRAAFLSSSESPVPKAHLVRGDNTTDPLQVDRAEAPEASHWTPFPPAELTILDTWRAGRSAHCRLCDSEHAFGIVTCPNGEGSVLPSLARFVSGGFVRVRVKMFRADFESMARPTTTLPDGRIAVRVDPRGLPAIWSFDSDKNQWSATGENASLFERLGTDDEYALALPPARGGKS